MPLKYYVPRCNPNYSVEMMETVFRLPKDDEERKKRIKASPRINTPDSKFTVICRKHWLAEFATVNINGKERLLMPLFVFSELPPCLIPTPPSKL